MAPRSTYSRRTSAPEAKERFSRGARVKHRPQPQDYAETEVLPENWQVAGRRATSKARKAKPGKTRAAVRARRVAEPADAATPEEPTFAEVADSNDCELYDQYVSELDKVPVLRDSVPLPRPALPADFRQGQRKDARKESRADAHTVREVLAGDLMSLYLEYLHAALKPRKVAKRTTRRRRKTKKK
jgi:hypothetical protein